MAPASRAVLRSAHLMADLTGIRVLAVEDHSDSLDLLLQSLTFMGASVAVAGTAREALPMIVDADVVITDFDMPGENGVWLLGQVNAAARPIPVILLSGFAASQRQAVADAPFARKLLKPIDPWDLAREIREVLGVP